MILATMWWALHLLNIELEVNFSWNRTHFSIWNEYYFKVNTFDSWAFTLLPIDTNLYLHIQHMMRSEGHTWMNIYPSTLKLQMAWFNDHIWASWRASSKSSKSDLLGIWIFPCKYVKLDGVTPRMYFLTRYDPYFEKYGPSKFQKSAREKNFSRFSGIFCYELIVLDDTYYPVLKFFGYLLK